MIDFVSSFESGFSPSLFKSFSFPSFFHERLFFSSQEKKINIVYLFFSFFLSLSLSFAV